ncbi:MAG: Hsp20/alpha crystallin family protein [Deltaproteobacteria bacterium]|nr:Hsp20/alpha crystallin family protein [Deltaproteobacteria bacterium]MBI5809767.1 Hsp20/alpha crystallin family protein [Deltaproteobacteria bacterium]
MAAGKGTGKDEEKKAPEEGAGPRQKGIAAGILHGVGKILGIGDILEKAGDNQLIKERLERIDEEIKRRLAESPLSARGASPRVSIPPGRRGGAPPAEKRQPEFEADIFDEGDYVMAVVPLPGVDASTIEASLRGERLVLSFIRGGRRYSREFLLPLPPEGELTKAYKNGVLKVSIGKKKS